MTDASEVNNDVMDVVRVPMFTLDSNYGWILRDRATGVVAAVDPAAPDLIQQALDDRHAVKFRLVLAWQHVQRHSCGHWFSRAIFHGACPFLKHRSLPSLERTISRQS